MLNLILVGAGGAVGAMARYGLSVQAARILGAAWPYGTLIANVVGGLLMGALAAGLAQRAGDEPERWRMLLSVGVLGGFTTFSAFSLEVVQMTERREWGAAAVYSLGSVVLSVGAVLVGLIVVRKLLS
jgi:fluoride exporter